MHSAYVCNVVIDLEFTTVPKDRRVGGLVHEIIEVGAVKLSPDGTVVGEFSHLVRPTMAGGVCGVVRKMTGIRTADVACARRLEEVLAALSAWVGPGRARFVTWSEADRNQIRRECAAKGISVPFPSRWLDIQRLYPRLMGQASKRKVALGEAADWCGIANSRTPAHRALYDAQMTAELFRMMAAGDCAEQHARVEAELARAQERSSCSSSIADRCGGLADLLAQLSAQDAPRAA